MPSISKDKNRNNDNLTMLLSQKGLVYGAPSVEVLAARVEKCKSENRPLRMLYGETFDEKGNTLDSMKYYLFTSLLAKEIKSKYGVEVEPVVLVADLGVYRNSPEQVEELKKHATNRVGFANSIKNTYNCSYNVVLLSDIASTPEFKARFDKVVKVSGSDEALMEMIKKTVPEDRREASSKNSYIYAMEEIATILGIDIKIGPPREKLYDTTANAMLGHFGVDPLMPVYLTPSYPMGVSYDSYLNSPIRQYGLTPYKAGSGQMAENRIVVGKTSNSSIETLIDQTEILPALSKPNPVMDVLFVADMARQHLQNSFSQESVSGIYKRYFDSKMESEELKGTAYLELQKQVLSILPEAKNASESAIKSGESDINPWGSEAVTKYDRAPGYHISEVPAEIKTFFSDKTFLFNRGLVLGHTDFEKIVERIKKKEDFTIISGFSSSGEFHYGHKAIIDTYNFFRGFAKTGNFVISDIDAYVSRPDDKIPDLKTAQRNAVENIADALALGVSKEDIRIQSNQTRAYYTLTLELPKILSFNRMQAVLGHTDLGKFTAVYLQIADILHPQMENGPSFSLIPVGIDQKPILRLAREAVDKTKGTYNFIPPSVIYIAHVPSLVNYKSKMSKSKPGSALLLNSDEAEFNTVLAKAVTGGRDTKAEQVKYGGNPDVCPIYELYRFNNPDEAFVKDIQARCASGKLLCNEDKGILAGFLRPGLEEHRRKREASLEIARMMIRV